jgi:hypothetical protein
VNYVWLLRIPADRTVQVVHVYRPLASGGEVGWPDEDRLRDAFCADDAFIRAWKALKPSLDFRGYTGVPGAVFDYALKTANTWNGPIRDFTLRLKKGSPYEIVSLCFPGTFRRVDPLTLEVHLQNFSPENDVKVYFGGLRDHFNGPGALPPRIESGK